jgi:hypothetical protein
MVIFVKLFLLSQTDLLPQHPSLLRLRNFGVRCEDITHFNETHPVPAPLYISFFFLLSNQKLAKKSE